MSSTLDVHLAACRIEEAFKRSFEHVHVMSNLIIPLPDGRRVKTAELDSLVVCEAGVFVFEVKGWAKTFVERIELAGMEKKQWVLRSPNGQSFNVCDPVAQGVEKMIELRKQLPAEVMSQNYVLFTGEEVTLCGHLPSSTLTLEDLPYMARMIRSNSKRSKRSVWRTPQGVQDLVATLKRLSSIHSHAEHVKAVIASKASGLTPTVHVCPANAPGLLFTPNFLSCFSKDCQEECQPV